MNKHQAILVTLVLSLMLSISLPQVLADYNIGFDVPIIGHISLYEPGDLFGTFLAGSIASALIMYVMITERRKK